MTNKTCRCIYKTSCVYSLSVSRHFRQPPAPFSRGRGSFGTTAPLIFHKLPKADVLAKGIATCGVFFTLTYSNKRGDGRKSAASPTAPSAESLRRASSRKPSSCPAAVCGRKLSPSSFTHHTMLVKNNIFLHVLFNAGCTEPEISPSHFLFSAHSEDLTGD